MSPSQFSHDDMTQPLISVQVRNTFYIGHLVALIFIGPAALAELRAFWL